MTSPVFALFENNLAARSGRLLDEHVDTLECTGPGNAAAFFDTIDAALHAGHHVALCAHYELGAAFETRAPRHDAAPLARALVFGRAQTLDAQALEAWWQHKLSALSPQMREAGLLQLVAQRSPGTYKAQVARILDYIRAGDCYQVNLSFPLLGQAYGHPLALAAKLRAAQPVQHAALIHDGARWLISRSPELFFAREGHTLNCRPMKGTATRGSTPEEDAQIAQTLQSSDKNRAENLMIVDLIRNDLGRLSAPGQVKVTELFSLETYNTVFQLTSSIEAHEVDASLREIFAALFPCGSITGAPKLRAMQIIDELEAAPRGIYCGALGWIAPDGDARFNIPIRTLELQDDGQCRLDVGSGIVADSEADAEYAECLAKARFAMPDDLQLIETLRCERTDKLTLPLLALHLERLARSAHALHFACDIPAINAALHAHAATLTTGTYRIRLLLTRDGRHQITSTTLDALPASSTITLADFRLNPEDPRLRHKTTARSFYDSALQTAMAAGHIDTLFLNTRGELCEGARSNLFIERDGKLLTPALQCGLLPGVLRAQLLTSGEAKEAVLRQEDLMRADRILIGNALRGLTTVELR